MATAKVLPNLDPGTIREHYDDFSWIYRLCWGEHIHHGLFANGESAREAQVAMVRRCAEVAGVVKGMRVVDVGCGHGGTARFLASEYGCEVVGLTISPTQIEVAQKHFQAPAGRGFARFVLADAERYEFTASHFDVVWNMESSEHFFNKRAYFKKAAAALKPGGVLMVAAWTGSMHRSIVREIADLFLCPELVTAEAYRELIQAAGLRITHMENMGPRVARTWDICADQARLMAPVTAVLPARFGSFARGIETMRRAYRSGELGYTILAAKKLVAKT